MNHFDDNLRSACVLFRLCGLLLLAGTAQAATRHVTTVAEFNSLGTLNAGDVVVVHAGIYPNVNRTITGNGTSDNPVTIYAEPLGSVAFSGPTLITLRGSYVTFAGFRFDSATAVGGMLNLSGVLKLDYDSRNCRVTNCMFRNFNQGAETVSADQRFEWLTVYGFNQTVDYCSFEGKQGYGVSIFFNTSGDTLTGERKHLIHHNYFGERTGIGDNGFEAMQVGVGGAGGTSDVRLAATFEYNYFFRALYTPGYNAGEAEVISNKTTGNVYRRNTFRECSGELNLRAGSDCIVEENYFLGNGVTNSGGVGVMDRNHIVRNNYFQDLTGTHETAAITIYKATTDGENLPVINAKIFHNTIVNCAQPFNLAYFFSNRSMPIDPVGTEIRNNVVQSTASGGNVLTNSSSTAVFSFSGNHVYHPTGKYGITGLNGVTYGPTPNLALDSSLGYYVPQPGSPILDVAAATDPVTSFDLRGLPRPATKADLGAFEGEAVGTGARPLVRSDVGPSYYGGPADTFIPPSSRLVNLSILTPLASGETLTLGTVLGGAGTSGSKALLVRAVGPSLAPFGVAGVIADPKLDLLRGQSVVDTNDNWAGATELGAAFAQVGAFGYVSGASKDAAVYVPALPAGAYTVQVVGADGSAGMVLAELYDSTKPSAFTPGTPRLINVSVLKHLNPTESMTAGFVVSGTAPRSVLIRAMGPTLAAAPFGIGGVLNDPKLELFSGGVVISANDDWGTPVGAGAASAAQLSTAFAQVGAFVPVTSVSKDAALLVTLAPGSYTARVSGAADAGGLVLVEVYEAP